MKRFSQQFRSGRRRWWLAATGLLLVAVVSAGCSGESNTVAADEAATTDSPIASMPFSRADGSQSQLSDYYGQPLVVNFFASWCPPCKAELPDIDAVHLEAKGEVKVLGISHDFTTEVWQDLIAETGIDFETVYQPDREIFIELELFGMPSTILINPEGEIVHTHQGIINAESLKALISEHLQVEVSP